MSDQKLKDVARETAAQVKAVTADATEAAKGAVGRGVAAVQEAGDMAQGMARQAAEQASAAAENLYGQGQEARDLVARTVEQNPFLSLLVAGAIGYGLACVVKNR